MSYIEMLLTDVERAARTMAECRVLAGEPGLDRIEAALMTCAVHADFLLGDVGAALVHARDAAASGRKAGDPAITGEALFYAAAMAFASDDPRPPKPGTCWECAATNGKWTSCSISSRGRAFQYLTLP